MRNQLFLYATLADDFQGSSRCRISSRARLRGRYVELSLGAIEFNQLVHDPLGNQDKLQCLRWLVDAHQEEASQGVNRHNVVEVTLVLLIELCNNCLSCVDCLESSFVLAFLCMDQSQKLKG